MLNINLIKKRSVLIGLILLPLFIITASANTLDQFPEKSSEKLWAELKTNGTVILIRHALAPGTGDPANFNLNNCATQRNLSEQGRAQARSIGAELRNRGIKIKQVLSSQWCRCLETAKLMNVGLVKPEPVLNSFFQDRSSAKAQTEALRQIIARHRQDQGFLVMVTHQVNITALTDIFPSSGGIVVVRGKADGSVQVLGQNP